MVMTSVDLSVFDRFCPKGTIMLSLVVIKPQMKETQTGRFVSSLVPEYPSVNRAKYQSNFDIVIDSKYLQNTQTIN